MKKLLLIALIVGGFILIHSAPSMAVHKGAGDLTCGACHTMHNSQGRSALNTDATIEDTSLILLRAPVATRAEIHMLCLQCHSTDGDQADVNQQPHGNPAPKVHVRNVDPDGLDIWDETASWDNVGAGGNFYPEVGAGPGFALNAGYGTGGAGTTEALGKGHSIGMAAPTPPGGDVSISGFSCTSCHDPHGTSQDPSVSGKPVNKFRNLKVLPVEIAGANGGVELDPATHTSWVGGVTGKFGSGGNYVPVVRPEGAEYTIWPIISTSGGPTGVPATDEPNSNSYGTGAVLTSAGISRWCAQCHDTWHESINTGNISGDDWKRHPVDNALNDGTPNSGAGVDLIRLDNYLPATPGQVLPIALDGTAATRVFYIPAAAYPIADPSTLTGEERVMCLSCHMVHGGPYYDNLRWDYINNIPSGAGSQTGNAIPETKGCQLCHNR